MKVLIVASKLGYQTRAFTDAARRLGLEPVLATDRCGGLDDPWLDHAFPLKFHRPEESARRLARTLPGPFAGVVAAGDKPALAAAHIAPKFNLPFHPIKAVAAAGDKYLARRAFAKARLPVPSFARFPLLTDPAEAARELPFPCVLKPLSLSGSRGVIRANTPAEFETAFLRIRHLLNQPEVLRHRDPALDFIQVESYLDGPEFALEGVLQAGRLHTLAIFDKPDPLEGPYFEESIYVTPARQPAARLAALHNATQRAASALGLSHGPIHAELRLHHDTPYVLEAAARPIGGLCARTLRFNGGVTLEEVLLRNATGQPLDSLALDGPASGVMMIPIGPGGIFQSCLGLDAARRTRSIEHIEITATPGQRFRPLPEGGSYLGFIFARAASPAAAEAALRRAHSKLDFRFSTTLPVLAAR